MGFWHFLHMGTTEGTERLAHLNGLPEPLLLPYNDKEVDENADKKYANGYATLWLLRIM